MLWGLARLHFAGDTEADQHAGINGGVGSHENAVFLYKAREAAPFVFTRFNDYFWLVCFGGFITGMSNFLFLPLFALSLQLPRKLAAM